MLSLVPGYKTVLSSTGTKHTQGAQTHMQANIHTKINKSNNILKIKKQGKSEIQLDLSPFSLVREILLYFPNKIEKY